MRKVGDMDLVLVYLTETDGYLAIEHFTGVAELQGFMQEHEIQDSYVILEGSVMDERL